jgi:hypothetical protein
MGGSVTLPVEEEKKASAPLRYHKRAQLSLRLLYANPTENLRWIYRTCIVAEERRAGVRVAAPRLGEYTESMCIIYLPPTGRRYTRARFMSWCDTITCGARMQVQGRGRVVAQTRFG